MRNFTRNAVSFLIAGSIISTVAINTVYRSPRIEEAVEVTAVYDRPGDNYTEIKGEDSEGNTIRYFIRNAHLFPAKVGDSLYVMQIKKNDLWEIILGENKGHNDKFRVRNERTNNYFELDGLEMWVEYPNN